MTIKRYFLALLGAPALALVPMPQAAHAQDISDMAEDDLSALVRFALPSVFQRVQIMCEPELAADSYIFTNGKDLQARFAEASEGSLAAAQGAILQLGGADDPGVTELMALMPPEVMAPFISEMIAGKVAQDLPVSACVPINRTMELLDPLPTQNFADLVAYLTVYLANEEKSQRALNTDG